MGFLASAVKLLSCLREEGGQWVLGWPGELCLPQSSLEPWVCFWFGCTGGCLCDLQLVVCRGAWLWRGPPFRHLPSG